MVEPYWEVAAGGFLRHLSLLFLMGSLLLAAPLAYGESELIVDSPKARPSLSEKECEGIPFPWHIPLHQEIVFIGRVLQPESTVKGWGHEGVTFEVVQFLKEPSSVKRVVRGPLRPRKCEGVRDFQKECTAIGAGKFDCSESVKKPDFDLYCKNGFRSEPFKGAVVVVDSDSDNSSSGLHYQEGEVYWVRAKQFQLSEYREKVQPGEINERWWTHQCFGTRILEGELEVQEEIERYGSKTLPEVEGPSINLKE